MSLRILSACFAMVFALVPCAHPQWQMQTSNTTADLRGIHNVGGGVAWASGTNGTVLRTEDGGYVWQTCAVPPGAEKLDFRGIQGFDAQTAVVMSSGKGDLSRLYKTTDGCHTWKLVFSNPDPDGFWDALVAMDHRLAILGDPVGGSFVIERSNDDGSHWKRDELPPSLSGEGAFAASNGSLLEEWLDGMTFFGSGGVSGARIFTECEPCSRAPFNKSDWATQMMPSFGKAEAQGIFSLAGDQPGTALHLVAVGGDYSKPDTPGSAAYSMDRFRWHSSITRPHGYRSSVAYDEKIKTWITVGPNGTDVSTDDGKNWRAVHPHAALHEAADADRNWNAISLPYVVGPKGRIGKLDEGAVK